MSYKYTVTGSLELDKLIDGYMKRVVELAMTIPHKNDIKALVLGGGYGRGEGGVFKTEDGSEKLYNDFDIFVISNNVRRSQRKRLEDELRPVSASLSEEMGIDVDFGPPQNVNDLPYVEFTMMWQELKRGHKVIYGSKNVLDALPERDINHLPLSEGARLLMNRGTGLLLAERKLKAGLAGHEDVDFVNRNIWKAVMACGDAYLITKSDYSFSYRQRLELLQKYKDNQPVHAFVEFYRKAIAFKLSPQLCPIENLPELFEHAKKCFREFYLYFFSSCYGQNFHSMTELQDAIFEKNLFFRPHSVSDLARNFVLALLKQDLYSFQIKMVFSYPRSRLFIVLPCLLFASEANIRYIKLLSGKVVINSPESQFKNYFKLWQRFN